MKLHKWPNDSVERGLHPIYAGWVPISVRCRPVLSSSASRNRLSPGPFMNDLVMYPDGARPSIPYISQVLESNKTAMKFIIMWSTH